MTLASKGEGKTNPASKGDGTTRSASKGDGTAKSASEGDATTRSASKGDRTTKSASKGDAGENLAARYLARQGLTLLERNYRCRFGEIDLIMREARTLVFVEVRMRQSSHFGGAAASITAAKQAKLVKTAQHYLARAGKDQFCRFDAILLSGADDGAAIEWVKDAFGAG